jgi:diguanylate cyclase (GGDEF)-like protein
VGTPGTRSDLRPNPFRPGPLRVKSFAPVVDNDPMAAGTARSTGRLFAVQAILTLVPVVLLGAIFAGTYRGEAKRRGIAVGSSKAELLAETAIEPLLTGHDLSTGLRASERAGLVRLVRTADPGTIVRLRLRDLEGHVVFSDDGSGFSRLADGEAAEAGRGHTIAGLTRLNEDANDNGPLGSQAVEVYTRLDAGANDHAVGVLEVYLPYAPIRADVAAGVQKLYRTIAFGLAALWLVMFLIALLVSRGLRQNARLNAFLAEHDALTGLPNRTQFHRSVQHAVDTAWRLGTECAVAIIDLDRFKEVNDTLGHHNGDLLLTELASRLEATMRDGDTVARLGGDEFVVLLERVTDVTDAVSVAEKIIHAIEAPIALARDDVRVSASVGIAMTCDPHVLPDTLLRSADREMYEAKRSGHGLVRVGEDPSRRRSSPGPAVAR